MRVMLKKGGDQFCTKLKKGGQFCTDENPKSFNTPSSIYWTVP